MSLQPQYSLLARVIEQEILPVCRQYGLGSVVYGALGGGVLNGRYSRDTRPDPDSRMGRLLSSPVPGARRWADALLTERHLDIAAGVADVAAELGLPPAQVALAWVAGRPGVTSVLLGPRSVAQLTTGLAALELTLPADALAHLNRLSHLEQPPADGSFFHLRAS